MLRLGTKVRHHGQDAMVIARTLGGHSSYDLRLADGSIVKYAQEADCETMLSDGGLLSDGGFRPAAGAGSAEGRPG
ncbi:hypothetical protein D9623_19435 [Azospirillum brasilense]|uniref:Uncharacterized protein n=1 Tax=Azospirillum brasilense TaxID=192 RepID=A0A0P0ENU6_AZOBR|nr:MULTISPECIES: hypothetical protein [Azospirillum]ALJ37717.1 hypothetical protein AMK58_20025 [Azospirillum brasilense]MDW7553937.1 hypothetical protein [Azospirillum brasilense]MDW7592624.1 hypothetical protein [Azospirillum brasilense]MDW7628155.1 hypothetical protein [Azospirillum brasilense]MDX5952093.1 hypothetical protein [Azospirillum brasilense]